MGSYWGHMDGALFFILLALWWAYNSFPAYIKALWHGDEYTSRMSYTMCGRRSVPIEAALKLFFSIFCIITVSVYGGGPSFVDENNHIIHLDLLDHISIFGTFVVHSGIDLLISLGVPLPRGLDRVTGAVAFTWYGIAFDYHSRMHQKMGLDRIIHMLPSYLFEMISVSLVVETIRPSWFMAHLARIYGLLCLGTWTIITSHVLYLPTPFPGKQPNPAWDHNDPSHVHFMASVFGYNLIGNMFLLTMLYIATLCVLKTRGQKKNSQLEQMELFKANDHDTCVKSI